jgi:hypothetical protein
LIGFSGPWYEIALKPMPVPEISAPTYPGLRDVVGIKGTMEPGFCFTGGVGIYATTTKYWKKVSDIISEKTHYRWLLLVRLVLAGTGATQGLPLVCLLCCAVRVERKIPEQYTT